MDKSWGTCSIYSCYLESIFGAMSYIMTDSQESPVNILLGPVQKTHYSDLIPLMVS